MKEITPLARTLPHPGHSWPGSSFSDVPQHLAVSPWPLLPVLADLTERLIAPRNEEFGTRIVDGLQALARALRMDWADLRYPPQTSSGALHSHSWRRDARMPILDDSLLMCLPPAFVSPGDGSSVPSGVHGHVALARDALAEQGCRFAAAFPVPLESDGAGVRGVLALGASAPDHHWSPTVLAQLRIAAAVFGQALRCYDSRQQAARDEGGTGCTEAKGERATAAALRVHHQDECHRESMQERVGADLIVGRSAPIQGVLEQLQQVAATDSTVLLLGETGTGKELLATKIHELSSRRGRPMVRVNCAAIPGTLIESELFGREKGAFTGALARQIGRFETADHSSIFLDEIGDLPAEVQVKLLRVLEERQIERLGSPRSLRVDVRIIAATHRDLEKRIADDAFREDLFYRLNVFPVRVPALRERAEDIPLLVWRFVIEFARIFGKRIDSIARESMARLQQYHWPGNIRELRNVVERAMIVASGPRLTIPLPATALSTGPVRVRLEEVEREHIRGVLERVRWRIRGMGGAAEQLGLRPTTLETRMAKLGLVRPKIA